jgi:hypothetical protein
MLRPKFVNILFYLFVKYFLFFLILGLTENRFKSLVIGNSESIQETFLNFLNYFVYVLIFILVLVLIFCAPFYFVLKIKKVFYFIPLLALVVASEYFLYTYLASQLNLINGAYNSALTILFLFFFFIKHIKLLFVPK